MRILLTFLSCFISSPAFALCSTATLDDDYQQSDVVVRAIVTAETWVADDEPDEEFVAQWGGYSPVTLHRLRVIEVFKGRPEPTVNLFQEVTSARFAVDVGQEYLIFLSYQPQLTEQPLTARGALYVRNACGQSGLWSSVDTSELSRLRSLSED